MFIWLITFFIFSPTSGRETLPTLPPYECGSHGRFEYCIDGIPGCVVGCHCHPGYYFDTDSKICEPNMKLAQDYRRHYMQEPTRVQVPLITSPFMEDPTTVSSRAIDDKIDEITNDADDLGDWLYNQFFKTIENQVINNTDNENIVQTRRSGGPPITLTKRTSRRSHKYGKAKKRKKKKKKGLKDKLLRITEDDSLFDSSSGSSTDDSSTSSSSESEEDHVRGESKAKDHGHKKILVVNKRPRPPLPSFIFLPNMETPFFPPIGLPPPAVPMYPMVPVPPMMAPPAYPPYPYPVLPHVHDDDDEATTSAYSTCSDHITTTAKESSTNGATTDAHTTTTTTEPSNDDNNEDNNEETKTSAEKAAEAEKEDETKDATKPDELIKRSRQKHRNITRQKLMKQLREKMKRKNKLQNFFANEYRGLEPPFLDIDMPPEFIPNPAMPIIKDDLKDELPPGLRDIDFKYLTQLIHRGNLNKTQRNRMRIPTGQPPFVEVETNVGPKSPSRRNYFDTVYINEPVNYEQNDRNIENSPVNYAANQPMIQNTLANPIKNGPNKPVSDDSIRVVNSRMNTMSADTMNNIYRQPVINSVINRPANIQHRYRIEETDDAYYTKLGRQIASMIRNIEGDKEVDIQIEKSNQKLSENPIFNGNNYGSRSYWERSVRSPYHYPMSFRTEVDRLKNSNEDLFSLENEVALAASTGRTLTLQELENVVSRIDRTKTNLIRKTVRRKPAIISKKSFNVNLLPKGNNPYYYNAAILKKPINTAAEYHPQHHNLAMRRSNNETTVQPEPRNDMLSHFRSLIPDIIEPNNTTPTKKIVVHTSLTRKPIRLSHSDIPVIAQPQVLSFKNSKSSFQRTNTTDINYRKTVNTQQVVFNRKNNNVFINNNNNRFINEKSVLPLRYPITNYYGGIGQRVASSYFHPYTGNFDYFEK